MTIPTYLVSPPGTLGKARLALRQLLINDRSIDAVYCSNDLLALGAITEARSMGLAVPDRLAVVGYGDLDFAPDTLPSLTSVRVNAADIGRLAAERLLEKFGGRTIPVTVTDVGFAIVTRDSA